MHIGEGCAWDDWNCLVFVINLDFYKHISQLTMFLMTVMRVLLFSPPDTESHDHDDQTTQEQDGAEQCRN